MNVETRIKIEKQIVRAIVTDAIAKGYTVSVWDGEDFAIRKSTNVRAIMDATMTTDENYISFYTDEKKIGWVMLVYGNDGWDVIADHSDLKETNEIVARASELANKLCLQYA